MTDIQLAIDQGVAVVTLSAPERRNALTPEMARSLTSICDEVDGRVDVGCLVIQGLGPSFCAGAERSVLANGAVDPMHPESYEDIEVIYRSFGRVGKCAVPTIAAVRGTAVGAGVNLALVTDLRVVRESTRLLPGFQRLGIHPGGGHFTLVSRLGGREVATAMGIFGEELDGPRAAALGMAWRCSADDAVESTAMELAQRVGSGPALARASIASMRVEIGPPALGWEASAEVERARQLWSLRRRGVAAGSGGWQPGSATREVAIP